MTILEALLLGDWCACTNTVHHRPAQAQAGVQPIWYLASDCQYVDWSSQSTGIPLDDLGEGLGHELAWTVGASVGLIGLSYTQHGDGWRHSACHFSGVAALNVAMTIKLLWRCSGSDYAFFEYHGKVWTFCKNEKAPQRMRASSIFMIRAYSNTKQTSPGQGPTPNDVSDLIIEVDSHRGTPLLLDQKRCILGESMGVSKLTAVSKISPKSMEVSRTFVFRVVALKLVGHPEASLILVHRHRCR